MLGHRLAGSHWSESDEGPAAHRAGFEREALGANPADMN